MIIVHLNNELIHFCIYQYLGIGIQMTHFTFQLNFTDTYFRNIIFSNISEIFFMCITDYFKLFQDAAQSKY